MRSADERDSTGAGEGKTEAVRQEGSAVANRAKEEAKDVAQSAREQGHRLADRAKTEARHVTEEARTQLRDQVSEQADRLGDSLRRLGDQVGALAEGRPEESGPLGDYARSAADGIRNTAGRVQEHGFDGLLEDTKRFARRRPGAFLCLAAVAGFSIGRLLRGGSEARKRQPERRSSDGEAETGDWQLQSRSEFEGDPETGDWRHRDRNYAEEAPGAERRHYTEDADADRWPQAPGGYAPPAGQEGAGR
jgi:hypothetical protein